MRYDDTPALAKLLVKVASRSASKWRTAAVVSSTSGMPDRSPRMVWADTRSGSVANSIRAALMQ